MPDVFDQVQPEGDAFDQAAASTAKPVLEGDKPQNALLAAKAKQMAAAQMPAPDSGIAHNFTAGALQNFSGVGAGLEQFGQLASHAVGSQGGEDFFKQMVAKTQGYQPDQGSIAGTAGGVVGGLPGALAGGAGLGMQVLNTGLQTADTADVAQQQGKIGYGQEALDVIGQSALSAITGKIGQANVTGKLLQASMPEIKAGAMAMAKRLAASGVIDGSLNTLNGVVSAAIQKYTGIDPNADVTEGAATNFATGAAQGVAGRGLHEAFGEQANQPQQQAAPQGDAFDVAAAQLEAPAGENKIKPVAPGQRLPEEGEPIQVPPRTDSEAGPAPDENTRGVTPEEQDENSPEAQAVRQRMAQGMAVDETPQRRASDRTFTPDEDRELIRQTMTDTDKQNPAFGRRAADWSQMNAEQKTLLQKLREQQIAKESGTAPAEQPAPQSRGDRAAAAFAAKKAAQATPAELPDAAAVGKWYGDTFNDTKNAGMVESLAGTNTGKYKLADVPVDQVNANTVGGGVEQPKVDAISKLSDIERSKLPPAILNTDSSGKLSVVDGTHRLLGRQAAGDTSFRAYVPEDSIGKNGVVEAGTSTLRPRQENFRTTPEAQSGSFTEGQQQKISKRLEPETAIGKRLQPGTPPEYRPEATYSKEENQTIADRLRPQGEESPGGFSRVEQRKLADRLGSLVEPGEKLDTTPADTTSVLGRKKLAEWYEGTQAIKRTHAKATFDTAMAIDATKPFVDAAADMSQADKIKFIDSVDQHGVSTNPQLDDWVKVNKQLNERTIERAKSLGMDTDKLRPNYIGFLAKHPEGMAEGEYNNRVSKAEGYLKARTSQGYEDHLAAISEAGLVPAYDNVVEMQQAKNAEINNSLSWREEINKAGKTFKNEDAIPSGWRKLPDRLANDPYANGALGGKGVIAVPEGFADAIDNYLANKDHGGVQALMNAGRTVRYMADTFNAARAVSGASIKSLGELSVGNYKGARPLSDLLVGRKLASNLSDPAMKPLADSLRSMMGEAGLNTDVLSKLPKTDDHVESLMSKALGVLKFAPDAIQHQVQYSKIGAAVAAHQYSLSQDWSPQERLAYNKEAVRTIDRLYGGSRTPQTLPHQMQGILNLVTPTIEYRTAGIRAVGEGAMQAGRGNYKSSPAAKALVGALAFYGLSSSAVQMAATAYNTGKPIPPESLEDLIFPRTGKKNPDGSAQRISVVSAFTPLAHMIVESYKKGMFEAGKSNIDPFIETAAEALVNRTTDGRKVGDSLDRILHGVSGMTPMLPTADKNKGKWTDPRQVQGYAQQLVGLREAPKYVERSTKQVEAIDKRK